MPIFSVDIWRTCQFFRVLWYTYLRCTYLSTKAEWFIPFVDKRVVASKTV